AAGANRESLKETPALWSALPGRAHAGCHWRALDDHDLARPLPRRPAEISGFRALARGYFPQHALRPAEDARGARRRRPAFLRRAPAARRICADREGARAAARHQGTAGVGRETHALGTPQRLVSFSLTIFCKVSLTIQAKPRGFIHDDGQFELLRVCRQ